MSPAQIAEHNAAVAVASELFEWTARYVATGEETVRLIDGEIRLLPAKDGRPEDGAMCGATWEPIQWLDEAGEPLPPKKRPKAATVAWQLTHEMRVTRADVADEASVWETILEMAAAAGMEIAVDDSETAFFERHTFEGDDVHTGPYDCPVPKRHVLTLRFDEPVAQNPELVRRAESVANYKGDQPMLRVWTPKEHPDMIKIAPVAQPASWFKYLGDNGKTEMADLKVVRFKMTAEVEEMMTKAAKKIEGGRK